jgi:hypothetical protein
MRRSDGGLGGLTSQCRTRRPGWLFEPLLTFPNNSLPLRNKHPKTDVEAALQEAEAEGFRVETGRGHWGVMYCPGSEGDQCPAPVWI